MNFEYITKNGTETVAPDMHGKMSSPFVPFSYRVPNFIELNDGTIVYFFEIKYDCQDDNASGCGALVRSHDGGKTWGEMRLLRYDGAPCGGGHPVYDSVNDTLILLARSRHWKPGCEQDHKLNENDQLLGRTYERFYVAKSKDGGLSWSDYREIEIEGIPSHWTVQTCGTPGIGIQLKNQKDPARNGRIVMPANRAELIDGKNAFRAHLVLSDDFGETWRVGGLEDYIGANESVAVELQDGTIVYNCRNQGGNPPNLRIQSYSTDGGETLFGSGVVETLYDPICHASMVNTVYGGKEYIFYSAPTGPIPADGSHRWGRREMLSIYASADGGKTYKNIKQVSPKGEFAAYSTVCATRGGRLLCAWETGAVYGEYRDIKYTSFDIGELVKHV